MKVSVIVPVYNGEKVIADCLKALLSQNYPKNKYEIIVVDDGSKDKTKEIVKKFRKVRLLQQEHKGPAAARNFGARLAKGKILLFTDADCIPDKDWIKNMVRHFEKGVVGVSGTYKTLNKESLVARFVGYEIERRHKELERKKYIDFIGTYSAGYRRDVFFKFKGFDESFPIASGEDAELSFRLAENGYKMIFSKDAFVWHNHPDSIFKLAKQQFWRGFWRVFLYRKHRNKFISHTYTPKTLYAEILFFILAIFSALLGSFSQLFYLLSLTFFIFWTFLLLPTVLFCSFKEKKFVILALPLILVRDVSIALGIFCGVVCNL